MSSNFRYYREAAQKIDQVGWCKGILVASDASACIVGAVRQATGLSTTHSSMLLEMDAHFQSYRSYRRVRSKRFGHRSPDADDLFGVIVAWNDSKRRRKRDVVKALNGLADELEARWLKEGGDVQQQLSQLEDELDARWQQLTTDSETTESLISA